MTATSDWISDPKINSLFSQDFVPALVVGNYCHDTLIHPFGQYEVLGGSASYIGAVFSNLGVGFKGVSKVGHDFKYTGQVKTAPLIQPQSKTTHFIDDFTSGTRQERLGAICDPIYAADLGTTRAQLGLACGIARELLPETLIRMRELCSVVICDIQGLIRCIHPETQKVSLCPLQETEFSDCLDAIDFLKVNERELNFVDVKKLSSKTKLLITRGALGCSFLEVGGERINVPAFPCEEIDSSGAGDCFVAGFAYGLIQGMNPIDAILQGNFFGSLAVRQVGVPQFNFDLRDLGLRLGEGLP